MTIIEVRGGDGRVRGRCDARCYGAKSLAPCHCICGGKNHGRGLDKAVEQSRSRLFKDEAADNAANRKED